MSDFAYDQSKLLYVSIYYYCIFLMSRTFTLFMSLLLVLLVVAGCAVPQEQLRMTQPQARQENELTIVSPRLHSHHPTFRVQCVNSEPLCRQRLAEFETLYQQFGEEINIVRETINHNTFQTSLPQQVTAQETIDQYFST